MKLITYQDDEGLWRWAIESQTGILLRSEQGYHKRSKALGQWQFLHKRLKKVERFDADDMEPRPYPGWYRFNGHDWVPEAEYEEGEVS